MHIELQQAMQHLVAEQSLNLKEVSRFTPVDFRLGIQYLLHKINLTWLKPWPKPVWLCIL
jgi:hypothetical protein